MTAAELLQSLTARDVRVEAAGGRLRVDAPAGILTDVDRLALAERKVDLLALLTEADRLISDILAAWNWPPNPIVADLRLAGLADAIDRHYVAGDMIGLRSAVAASSAAVKELITAPSSAAPDLYRECPGCLFCLPAGTPQIRGHDND